MLAKAGQVERAGGECQDEEDRHRKPGHVKELAEEDHASAEGGGYQNDPDADEAAKLRGLPP